MTEINQTNIDQEQHDKIVEKYLARRNFKNKIAYIVALSISLVLVVTVLCLALIQYNVRPGFLSQGQVSAYEVSFDDKYYSYDNDNQDFESVEKLYNQTFKTSLLTAIFQGQTAGFNIGDGETTTPFDLTTPSSTIGSSDYFKVEFAGEEKVLDNNGKIYQSIRNDEAPYLTYNCFYFALQKEKGMQTTTIFIPVYGNIKNNPTRATITSIKVEADLYNFSQSIQNLVSGE